MKRETKAAIIFLLAAPLLLGAVASKQQGATNDLASTAPVLIQNHPAPEAQPTTLPPTTDEIVAPAIEPASAASNYAIDWYSINGGGTTTATSTNYKLGASIGQSVAGAATSTNYQMGIGFWYGAGNGCACPCKYDPSCDGVISDVLDVTTTINVAFRGVPAVSDPGCPAQRADVDNSGAVDVVDVSKVINVAFRGQTIAANYVDPCF